MARSFAPAVPGETVSDFYNESSDTHFAMSIRGGKYYQRRWQIGFGGKKIHAEELSVDYVLGSGNHARTYLSRTDRGTLIQLPLGWYSEKGGYWGVNPGYDTAHPPSHRPIAYECMFCHNSYPEIPAKSGQPESEPVYSGSLPQGIGCQRCHGSGEKHRAAALRGAPASVIRAAIVNPGRLSKDRQMDICMQCHLEPASTRLPSMVRVTGRTPFSYKAGEPLTAFIDYFDHAPGTGYADKFEIAGSAYRLRQSQCFLKSKGELTCQTCHNPHDIPRGKQATLHYASVCRGCHAARLERQIASALHPPGDDCVSCHMPKRRTTDAVHVAMTDHLIRREALRADSLAELPERHPSSAEEYRDEVVPYYPADAPARSLMVAMAQVLQASNLTAGIERLSAALAKQPNASAEYYKALGDAWRRAGDAEKAVAAYRRAVNLQPDWAAAWRSLGIGLRESKRPLAAQEAFARGIGLAPRDARTWFDLAVLQTQQGDLSHAAVALAKASTLDPDLPDVWNSIALARVQGADTTGARAAFETALRIDPYAGAANSNFARFLAGTDQREESLYYFEKAAQLKPLDAVNRYEFALTLVQLNRFDESKHQAGEAIARDPALAEAHELLGGLLARERDFPAALIHYREAVRLKPGFGHAQLDLGLTLALSGDRAAAMKHFREAAKSRETGVAEAALKALNRLSDLP